jgi:hypothetical protein
MNLLLPSLLVAVQPSHAEERPSPVALVYTDGVRREMESAIEVVEGWLAAAQLRDDVDERMCLKSKLTSLTTYAVVAAGAWLDMRDHLAAGDTPAVALDVRKVSVAADRSRTLYEHARACLLDAGPELSTVEDPDLWHTLPFPFIEEGRCGDSGGMPDASPC